MKITAGRISFSDDLNILFSEWPNVITFFLSQADEYSFNRGKLMNVGYKEAIKYAPFNCFVFHDVDLIPEDDRIDYGCPASPMHLSVAVDKFHYK